MPVLELLRFLELTRSQSSCLLYAPCCDHLSVLIHTQRSHSHDTLTRRVFFGFSKIGKRVKVLSHTSGGGLRRNCPCHPSSLGFASRNFGAALQSVMLETDHSSSCNVVDGSVSGIFPVFSMRTGAPVGPANLQDKRSLDRLGSGCCSLRRVQSCVRD